MSGMASFGILLIRAIVGAVFVFHGSQKLFGWFGGPGMEAFTAHIANMGLPGGVPPQYLAYAAAISEFGGGILLILGLITPIAAICIAATMAVAVFKVHGHAFALANDPPGMEYALTLGVVALGLVFTGAGRISLDALMPWGRNRAKSNKKSE